MENNSQPQNIQVIGNELAIIWSSGEEFYFPLKELRDACPCAYCQGEPDVTGKVIKLAQPDVPSEGKYELKGYEIVGGYAFQPIWGDGHKTGLYSWKYLKSLQLQQSAS